MEYSIKVILFFLFIFSFNGCLNEEFEIPLDPVEEYIFLEGYDFQIKGHIDNEPIELRHISHLEYNESYNRNSFYISSQFNSYPERNAWPDLGIELRIWKFDAVQFSDLLVLGDEYTIFDAQDRKQFQYVISVDMIDKTYSSSKDTTISQYLNISKIEVLPNDPNLNPASNGKLYRVEGSFHGKLEVFQDPSDFINIEVDSFSMLFYDDF